MEKRNDNSPFRNPGERNGKLLKEFSRIENSRLDTAKDRNNELDARARQPEGSTKGGRGSEARRKEQEGPSQV